LAQRSGGAMAAHGLLIFALREPTSIVGSIATVVRVPNGFVWILK